jgi:hypothetical protein
MENMKILLLIDIAGFVITSIYVIQKYGIRNFWKGWKELIEKFIEIVKEVLNK